MTTPEEPSGETVEPPPLGTQDLSLPELPPPVEPAPVVPVAPAEVSTVTGTAAATAMAPLTEERINNAFVIELVAGLLGFLGIGYMYTGRTTEGLIRLVGWWVLAGIMVASVCLIPLAMVGWLVVPIGSAMQLRKTLQAQRGPAPG
jgi:TM2 domain-containing membrane protein YozV